MKQALSNVTEVFAGLSVLRRHGQGRGTRPVPVINVSDLEADGVAPADRLPRFTIRVGPATDRYRVQAGDVLVTARGTVLKVAVVGAESAGAIASSNLLVIRPGPEVLPAVLLAFLRSGPVQAELLASGQSSSRALSLTASDLGRLQVPLPPLAEQRRIVELLQAADANYRSALQAAELRRQVAYEVANRLLTERNQRG